jgi:hypothetical protein
MEELFGAESPAPQSFDDVREEAHLMVPQKQHLDTEKL